MQIEETKENRQRGVLALYALPDTCSLGLTEAQAYAMVWDTFHEIQMEAPRAIVYYGQETGVRQKKEFDEIGILLPIHEFEKKMLHPDLQGKVTEKNRKCWPGSGIGAGE